MISRTTIESLREFDTALLANTLGHIGSTAAHEWYMGGSIQSQTPDIGPTVGLAVTCQVDTGSPGNKNMLQPYFDQVQRTSEMELPTIWIVETVGSRPDHECVIGDGMAKMLYSVGCQGVITNGYCRDIAGCQTVPFAVHCRGTIAHHTELRFVAMDVAVEVGGITVKPGELIHADHEGVIKIPAGMAESLVQRAPLMRAFEHDVHVQLRRTDLTVQEKRDTIGERLEKYGFTAASPQPGTE